MITEDSKVGVIVAISDLNIKVLLDSSDIKVKDILYADINGYYDSL